MSIAPHLMNVSEALYAGYPLYLEVREGTVPKYRVNLRKCKSKLVSRGKVEFTVPPKTMSETVMFTSIWLVAKVPDGTFHELKEVHGSPAGTFVTTGGKLNLIGFTLTLS